MSSAPARGEERSIAAYSVADLPIQSLSRALASCSGASAHSPQPVKPERVLTRSTVYRLPETGSRTGNQRISAIGCLRGLRICRRSLRRKSGDQTHSASRWCDSLRAYFYQKWTLRRETLLAVADLVATAA